MPQDQSTCVCGDSACTIPFGLCHCGCGEKTLLARETRPAHKTVKGLPSRYLAGHSLRHKRVPRDSGDPSFMLLPISAGRYSKIDPEDYRLFGGFMYRLARRKYAARTVRGVTVFLHRDIMNAPEGTEVDHINGDGLDNRRCNLRVCTRLENAKNRKMDSRNKSGYTGIYWAERDKGWRVYIGLHGKLHFLGFFKRLEDAIQARKDAEEKYYGSFASKRT